MLRTGDLIDDRELVNVDRDRLDHERVAHELVDLVATVETPTNIALYGPWGSGKSGIANLVRAEIEDKANKKRYNGVRFARFDAFKYAENPLRRNFIHAVADELNIKDDKYGKDLYAGKTKTKIDVPDRDKLEIAGWFIGLSVVLIAALVGVIALLTLLQPGDWRRNFGENFSAALPAGLISPVLLAAVFTLVGKTLTIDRSIERPDSVEQFEDLFKDLVRDSKAKRLVIFVDELDRCTAKEVVATLDAIRTFLGVDKCVFVVAADQHVLEQALSEEARQETPKDSVNPYYSTGSAYLDKVFQYQVSLPPLLPQSVTEFAIKAVAGKGGLWDELAPVDYVVSVLIPSHVTSPRRVKHLLNTFALTYRLAQSKHASGRLQEDPYASAQAIARLVCLRVEFPNFARDLILDPNLPAHVLALLGNPDADLGPRVAPNVRERALAYATGEASPARLLNQPDPDDDDLGAEDPEQDDTEEAKDSAASTDTERGAGASESGARAQQGRQLHTYLTRTRLIEGPSRDLIYLHSVGSVYGVPDDIASDLISALENGQFDDTVRIYRDADEDARLKIVQFVAGQIHVTFGIERLNAAHALLDLAQREPLPNLDQVADTAGQAIAEMHRSGEAVLTADSTPGAWAVASASTGDGATTLKRTVLTHLEAQTTWEATYLFSTPVLALDADPGPAAKVMAREITSERAPQVAAAMKDLDHPTATRVLSAVGAQAGRNLADLFRQQGAYEKAVKEAEQEAAAGTADAETAAPNDPQLPIAITVAALEDLAGHWAEDHADLSWAVTYVLLLGNHQDSRQAVLRLIPHIGQTDDHRIVTELLRGVVPRPADDWDTWLRAVPADALQDADGALLVSAASRLFGYATDPERAETDDDFKRAIEQITRLAESRPEGVIDLTDEAVALLDTPVTTEEEATSRMWNLDRIRPFAMSGFVDRSAVAKHEISNMRQTIAQRLPEQPETADITTYFTKHAPALTEDLADPAEEDVPEFLAWPQEIRTTAMLSERLRMQTSVGILDNAPLALRDQAREQAPSTDEIVAFVGAHGRESTHTVRDWIHLARPDRAATVRLLDAARENGALTEDAARACDENAQKWDEAERLGLIEHYIADPNEDVTLPALLRAVGYHRADPAELARALVKRFQASGSNASKDTVIDLWKRADFGQDQASTLYHQILIPWLSLNTKGSTNADAARRALQAAKTLAVEVPADLRDNFAEVVREATEGDKDLTRTAIPALEILGYSADRVGFLRKRLEVSDQHDE